MATAQPQRVIYPTATEGPLARSRSRQRTALGNGLAVAAVVAPAVAVTFLLGRRILRGRRSVPKTARLNVSLLLLHLSVNVGCFIIACFMCSRSGWGPTRNRRQVPAVAYHAPRVLCISAQIRAANLLRSCCPASRAFTCVACPQALPDGAVPAGDSLDALGLKPGAPLPAVSAPPPALPLQLFDANIACSLQQLFRIIMGPDAAFIKAQHSQHKYWDVSISEWAKCAGTVGF